MELQKDISSSGAFGKPLGLSFLMLCGILGVLEYRNWFETISLLLFFFCLFLFISKTNKSFPLKELLATVSVLQWLIGPVIMYRIGNPHPIYKMFVEEPEYMSFALPGTCLFLLALLFPIGGKKIDSVNNELRKRMQAGLMNETVAKKLIVFGFLCGFVPVGGGLGFIFFLFSQTIFIGALILFTNSGIKNKIWLAVVLIGMLNTVLESASFHTPILWLTMFFVFRAWKKQWSLSKIYALVLLGAIGVFFVQFVKTDFRSDLRSKRLSRDELIWEKTLSNFENSNTIFSQAGLLEQLPRINQGGVISRVMAHTPENEPFARGETLFDTFVAVFLPRFLAPNKKKAGGRENYVRFTGFDIRMGTSINISPLGEMWANFGQNGIWGMLIYGLVLNLIWLLYYKQGIKHPFVILWLPLFFLQTVKAETDILTPINHMFKSAIIIYIFFKWVFPSTSYNVTKVK